MDSKVFVFHEGPHNYTPAMLYGDVSFITNREISPFVTSQNNEAVWMDIRKFISIYHPGTDYLIPTGSTVLIAYVFMYISRTHHPSTSHALLKWDNQMGEYIEFTLDLDGVMP